MRAPAPIRRASRSAGPQNPTSTAPRTDGATALAVQPVPAAFEAPIRRRTPLAVVPAVTSNRRLPFLLLCVFFLMAALAGVLLLNIQVSSGQYELVKLRGQERTLTQENEALAEQVQHLQAPQNLADKAADLGMVKPGDVAAIDLGTGKVSGVATPATEKDTVTSFVEAPKTAPEPVKKNPVKQQAPPAEEAEPQQAAGQGESPQRSDSGARAGDRQAFSDAELNGGTIPAPTLNGDQP
ncbi:hypothetical protein [Zhihengliuella sp.]|uniref:hypothetical protein n=1 Tax=Zhihengliuella sp. TaxID=1954483 RepID=UPI00281248C8|nr:hypothetical protein [Zhihengliuella sp.]